MNTKISNRLIASTIVLSAIFNPISVLAATGDSAVTTTASNDAIEQAKALGLMIGDPNGDFRPGDAVSRVELAKLLCTMFHLQVEPAKSSSFADVTADDWGVTYIEAVHRAGLMSGDGYSFRPNDTITREEMAVVLVHALGLDAKGKGEQLSANDKAAVSPWAQDAVQAVKELGFMNLSSNFAPQQPLNRQEVATVVVGVVDRPAGELEVKNGSLRIGGMTYEISYGLQGILNAGNANALKGAKLDFIRDGFKITGLKRLELNQKDSVLEAQNTELTGDVIVNAPMTLKHLNAKGKLQVQSSSVLNVEDTNLSSVDLAGQDVELHAKGKSHVGELVVQGKASIATEGDDASIEQLQLGDQSTAVEIKGYVKNLVVSDKAKTVVTLADGAKLDKLIVPNGINPKDVIADYDKVKYLIPMVNNGTNQDLIVYPKPAPAPVPDPVPGDLTALSTKIALATTLKTTTQVGTTTGHVPQSALDALDAAITAAQAVLNNPDATDQEIADAVTALTQAISAFQSTIVEPFVVSLAPGASFPLNSGQTGTAGDTTIKDDSGMAPFPQYNKRNIKNLLQVKRGTNVEGFIFNSTTHNFDVLDASQTVLASVSLTSSSPEVTIVPAVDGLTVHPLDSAVESTVASLVFHVNEDGTEVGQATLPITMDETAPTIVSSTYNSGMFTLTASEPVTSSPIGPPNNAVVEFSQSGDFNADKVVLQSMTDFVLNPVSGNQITITLMPNTMTNLTPQASSKFRITLSGYGDDANNQMSQTVTIDVPNF